MLLSAIIFFPLVSAALLLVMRNDKAIRVAALVLSITELLLSLKIFQTFNPNSPNIQLAEKVPWIKTFGINYFVGVDGISLWLVILTTLLTPIIILGSWTSIDKKVKAFHANLLLLETAMIGTFLAMDAVLFYVFFEASLIPMYFIVGIWGGARRIYATVKFFIYTMTGSVLMLVAIIGLLIMTEYQFGEISASLLDFYRLRIPFVGGEFLNPQTLMFFAFALAFAIKVPMFPVHTWLPDAHVEAPTPGSVILAGVMLKMGTYGFMRFVIPLFPQAAQYWGWLFLALGAIGIVYGALVAMVQPDMKKLVAYSSVSHMGYVVIGIFALNAQGLTGALYQMLNHGVSTGALFLLVGMIYERTHSREIAKYGGLALVMPLFAVSFFIVTLSSIGVPGTNGFVGEFLILMGAFNASKWVGIISSFGVVFGACYMLWMYKRVFFGKPGELVGPVHEDSHGHHDSAAHAHEVKGAHAKSGEGHGLLDLSFRELVVLAPLVVLIFWMGVFPKSFLHYSEASLSYLETNKMKYELVAVSERGEIIANSASAEPSADKEEK